MNLDRIEALAKAATPGPWDVVERNDPNESAGVTGQAGDDWGKYEIVDSHGTSRADAAYIAAVSPNVVLDLVAIARAARDFVAAQSYLGPGDFAGDKFLELEIAVAKLPQEPR